MEEASGYLDARIDAIREHLLALVAAAPQLPAELERVRADIAQEMAARGWGTLFLLLIGFVGLGFAREAGAVAAAHQPSRLSPADPWPRVTLLSGRRASRTRTSALPRH